jgi:hypothetical protein
MAACGEGGLRIAGEAETLAGAGWRVGLLHLQSRSGSERLSPDIRRVVAGKSAVAIGEATAVSTRLCILHAPSGMAGIGQNLRSVSARRIAAIGDRTEAGRHRTAPAEAVPVTWFGTRWPAGVPTGRQSRAREWPVVIPRGTDRERPAIPERPVTVAYPSIPAAGQWPSGEVKLQDLLPADGSASVILHGRPPKHLLPAKTPKGWRIFSDSEMAVGWMLREADILAYFPDPEAAEFPEATIAAALAAGKAVLVDNRLAERFGAGVRACAPAEARTILADWIAAPDALAAQGAAARKAAAKLVSPKRFLAVAEPLAGLKPRAEREKSPRAGNPRGEARAAQRAQPVALFVASNGIGLGHVARLLAIARRSEGRFAPVFATMAQAVHIIEKFGYRAEYIPSLMYTGAPPILWDDWFGFEIERLIATYGARIVVYDGNDMPAGLLRAVMADGGCRLAWVRRSMGEKDPLPPVETARFCDVIIEPGEFSIAHDFVGMPRKRRGMEAVDPIRLLDDEDVLPRDEAAAALSLDPKRPAVLIHAGAGANRDVAAIVEATVRALHPFKDAQVAIAEWANAPAEQPAWPEAVALRGFPLSRYYRAFDFSVGASGYNTFHDVIAAELPTVFVANTAPGMDDQLGRARHAQDWGAAIELPEDRLFELPRICEVLMSGKAREVMRANCRKLARPNGAAAAAELVGALA